MPLRKPEPAPSAAEGSPVLGDKTMAQYPLLLSYLMDERYEDGSPREKSALSVFVEDGRLKVALNDKDCRRSLYVASDGLQGGLKAMESLLGTGKAEWRAWGKQARKK